MKTKLYCLLGAIAIIAFSCKKDKGLETVTDVDGNVYKTVKIGDQVWMAENLKVTRLNDGTAISFVDKADLWSDQNISVPMFCYYDNDPANIDKYGLLYNWNVQASKKLAPKGWHVPTEDDWNKLQNFLVSHGYNYDGSTIENKIAKALAATSGWVDDSTVGSVGNDQASNNKSGLNIPAAGARDQQGIYTNKGALACLWSFSETGAIGHQMQFDSNEFYKTQGDNGHVGLSVRCVKD